MRIERQFAPITIYIQDADDLRVLSELCHDVEHTILSGKERLWGFGDSRALTNRQEKTLTFVRKILKAL